MARDVTISALRIVTFLLGSKWGTIFYRPPSFLILFLFQAEFVNKGINPVSFFFKPAFKGIST